MGNTMACVWTLGTLLSSSVPGLACAVAPVQLQQGWAPAWAALQCRDSVGRGMLWEQGELAKEKREGGREGE